MPESFNLKLLSYKILRQPLNTTPVESWRLHLQPTDCIFCGSVGSRRCVTLSDVTLSDPVALSCFHTRFTFVSDSFCIFFHVRFIFVSYSFHVRFIFVSHSFHMHLIFVSYSFDFRFMFVAYSFHFRFNGESCSLCGSKRPVAARP